MIHRKIILFLSKEYLDRSITFFLIFRTQYTPDFFVSDSYGSGSWWTKGLASVLCIFNQSRTPYDPWIIVVSMTLIPYVYIWHQNILIRSWGQIMNLIYLICTVQYLQYCRKSQRQKKPSHDNNACCHHIRITLYWLCIDSVFMILWFILLMWLSCHANRVTLNDNMKMPSLHCCHNNMIKLPWW
jgi:hypothetical protein